MEEWVHDAEGAPPPEEPVLLVGHSPDEHGILREIACGAPRPVMCRLCHGERDCPYVAARSPLRLKVTYRAPTDPVPPLEHRTISTGVDGTPSQARHPMVMPVVALSAWVLVAALVVWFWILHRPSAAELGAMVGLKLAVFVFVVAGIPLARLTWSHHGGRFRRSA